MFMVTSQVRTAPARASGVSERTSQPTSSREIREFQLTGTTSSSAPEPAMASWYDPHTRYELGEHALNMWTSLHETVFCFNVKKITISSYMLWQVCWLLWPDKRVAFFHFIQIIIPTGILVGKFPHRKHGYCSFCVCRVPSIHLQSIFHQPDLSLQLFFFFCYALIRPFKIDVRHRFVY